VERHLTDDVGVYIPNMIVHFYWKDQCDGRNIDERLSPCIFWDLKYTDSLLAVNPRGYEQRRDKLCHKLMIEVNEGRF
jgi:hypothetical protein